jgi:hypothetical protein
VLAKRGGDPLAVLVGGPEIGALNVLVAHCEKL